MILKRLGDRKARDRAQRPCRINQCTAQYGDTTSRGTHRCCPAAALFWPSFPR